MPAARLHFSVAHAPGALLCALSADGELGVDVERAERGSGASAERLARRYFSLAEAASLAALPDERARVARFVELWTLKEAYVKALGRGIAAAPLSGFSFTLSPCNGDDAAGAPRRISFACADGVQHTVAPRGQEQQEACSPPPGGWHFRLLRLSGSDRDAAQHLAAVCATGLHAEAALTLRCWRTVPLAWDRPATSEELRVCADGVALRCAT